LADLASLQEKIGIKFERVSLLEMATNHTSYVNENPAFAPESNERLEFLGDAILGFVIAEKLYNDFPNYSEGELTKLRSALVCRDSLARAATSIELGDYLSLGKGERVSGGRHKDANLAGAFEALIAAVFFDKGMAVARDFILDLLGKEVQMALSYGTKRDYKSRLQEATQSSDKMTPVYRLLKAEGPDHEKWFTVEVLVGNNVLGNGSGKSKKMAENEAARTALKKLLPGFTE